MTLYVSNRDGNGKTDEQGHYKFQTSVFLGNTLEDTALQVTQNTTPALNVFVQPGQFKIDTNGYSYTGWNDNVATVGINTPDASNTRITSVVAYVDKSASTAPTPPNNPNIAKLITVDGVPAASPTAPTASQIQTAVGPANPYIILANITVPSKATQIINANIADMRVKISLADNIVANNSIRDNSVNGSKLLTNSVSGTKLVDGGITVTKFADGSVTDQKWRNTVAFLATRTGTKSLSASTWTKMSPDSISYNIGNGYSNTSDIGRFTVPVTGIYTFAANLFAEAAPSGRIIISFYKNGGNPAYRVYDMDAVNTGNRRANGTLQLLLNAGDYIEPYIWVSGSGNVANADTWFSGALITRI